MKTDKELLEAAAKTAGLRIIGWTSGGLAVLEGERYWQPLERDADALRLAVKLRLVVHVWDDGYMVSAAKTLPDGEDPDARSNAWHSAHEHPCGGIEAAARRAIVRAAAALGDHSEPRGS